MDKLSPFDKILVGGLVVSKVILSELLMKLYKLKQSNVEQIKIEAIINFIEAKTVKEMDKFLDTHSKLTQNHEERIRTYQLLVKRLNQ